MPSKKVSSKGDRYNSKALPWLQERGELDLVIKSVAEQFYKDRLEPETPEITAGQEAYLTTLFHRAEHARSSAGVFMRSLAKAAGINDPAMIQIGGMKSRERAMRKLLDPSRGLRDLGRGRIFIRDIKDYCALYKLLKSIRSDGTINGVNCRSTTISFLNNGSKYSNYMERARRSGYMGSINLDLDINLGKNRHGFFEVQIMPLEYVETYDRSHLLYELIRKIEPIPSAMRSNEQEAALAALCVANNFMFREEAARAGFDSIAQDSYETLSFASVQKFITILDKMRDAIEHHPKRKILEEMPDEDDKNAARELMDAITYAKSSLANIYFSQNFNPELEQH